MEEKRDVLVSFFGIPQEETPTNSDADLPLPGNGDDSDSTIILNMDEHMQRMEDEDIQEWAPTSRRAQPQSITGFVRGDP
ncbi:hypothetical protein JTB14_032306 [Gonioctena quinquepunctata]|nr:hypothetical protein JTB14_032306 [Gonioctena quinquepunctata]